MSQALPSPHTLTHVLLALKLSIAATCFVLYGILCSCIVALGSSRPLLTNGGGGGGGSLWGSLRTRQPTHPPKLTHPPTHPEPPLPPHRGGGAGLCCYNQLVTQKPCVFAQKKFCPSVTMRSLNSSIAELAVTLVVDHCTGNLGSVGSIPTACRPEVFRIPDNLAESVPAPTQLLCQAHQGCRPTHPPTHPPRP